MTKTEEQYIRVGTDYFKIITKPDRFGIKRIELKKWNKDTIVVDFGRKFLDNIKKYDDFILEPNNTYNINVYENCYNIYHSFPHKSKKGEWPWTFILMKQIFGEQFKTGMKYIKVLYEHPKQQLPILAVVSEERGTGKSTFMDWLNMLFGANMTMIEPDVIGSTFNSEYATSNIIGIEETIMERQMTIQKLKSLATRKFISVNIKNVQQFKVPFYGKIILASNEVDKFMRIDDKEIRYWVRRLPTMRVINHNILNDMISEIPAFLYYLENMPKIDFSKSRSVFTPEEIGNEYLASVKKESKSGLYKEITEYMTDYFLNNNDEVTEFKCTPGDIKYRFFERNNNISINYIRLVLIKEYGMKPGKSVRYKPFGDILQPSKTGKPFTFFMKNFTDAVPEKENVPF